ncbi:sulfate transporter [Arthrobacter citreus]|nr:sulfate transporter [Arthrobacter citreus]
MIGVSAIDKIVIKFHENDIKTNIIGLNPASKSIVDSIALFNKPSGINENIGQ